MKLILTGLAALYLAGFVVMTVVYVVKFNGLFKKSRLDLNLNGESVTLPWFVYLGIYLALFYQSAKRAVVWPWSMYRDRDPKEWQPENDGSLAVEIAASCSRDNLPRGDAYIREVKQTRFQFEAEFERLMANEERHKLVVADVLLDFAWQAIIREKCEGRPPGPDEEDLLLSRAEAVIDGEVQGARNGVEPPLQRRGST